MNEEEADEMAGTRYWGGGSYPNAHITKSFFLMPQDEWDDIKYALIRRARRYNWNDLTGVSTSATSMPYGELDRLDDTLVTKAHMKPTEEQIIHRMDVGREGKPVRIFTWGCESLSANPEKKEPKMLPVEDDLVYDSVDDLPEWMQRKLAVLSSIDCSNLTEELEGVGRRISGHVFWVYPSAGEKLEKK
jgi:hypothetical protein